MFGRDIPPEYLKDMESMTEKQAAHYAKRFPMAKKEAPKPAAKKAAPKVVKTEEDE